MPTEASLRKSLQYYLSGEARAFTVEELGQGDEFYLMLVRTLENLAITKRIKDIRAQAEQLPGKGRAKRLFDEEIAIAIARLKADAATVEAAREASKRPAAVLTAVVRQEPVGHGGFHHGVVGAGSPSIRWIYDCGSWHKKDILKRRIDELTERCRRHVRPTTDVDLLFISHFDGDHVSGLGMLLERNQEDRLRVDTAVIPYLSPVARFRTLAAAAARDKCSSALIDAVAQPAKYCADRGIRRLIVVRPNPTDGGADGLPPVRFPGSSDVPESRDPSVEHVLEFIDLEGRRLPSNQEHGIEVVDAPFGTKCGVAASGTAWADWWFVPYADQWVERESALVEKVEGLLKLSITHEDFDKELIERFSTRCGLQSVRENYKPLNANRTSLSLYAGRPWWYRQIYPTSSPAGWLLTGDSCLKEMVRFKPWKEYFAGVSRDVGHLMVPHHGSAANFNESLPKVTPKAQYFVTINGSDERSGRRPSEKAKRAFNSIKIVSELDGCFSPVISGPHDPKQRYLDW
ncbi:MAG: hypothetical protein U1E85_00250 [Rhodocyclaceae bacterium]